MNSFHVPMETRSNCSTQRSRNTRNPKTANAGDLEPVRDGLVIMHGVDRSRIESAFRPVRKLGDKAS
jgi:hypothetical protein